MTKFGSIPTLTYHYDYRGSTVALTDGNGNVTDRMEYSLYATMTYRAGTNDSPFLFNGRYGVQTDPNGLLYMRARYYNPYLCRFLNADPSGFAGGLNFYTYANGNPVSYLDPFGLGAVGENVNTSWVNTWNPNEFYQTGADWKNDINNSHSWPVAGILDTLVDYGAGIASIPYLGSGSGTFSADPSWQNAPLLLGDISTAAGLAAGGLSPLASAETVANPVPSTLARVIPNGIDATTLGLPSDADVFVTDASQLEGLNAQQIAAKLGIQESPTGFQIFQFTTPESGLASPVFRSNPGFIGGGQTSGGASEFVIPNGPIPSGATTTIVH